MVLGGGGGLDNGFDGYGWWFQGGGVTKLSIVVLGVFGSFGGD